MSNRNFAHRLRTYDVRRAAAAARSRRCRQRARDGVMIMQIAIPTDYVLDLVDAGFLAAAEGEDRTAIARAIERFLLASRVTPCSDEFA